MMWSWILTAIGLTGFILAGRKVWWAWHINIACQALWFTYAIVTDQFGFIVASLVYTVVFTQNAIKWTRARNKNYEWAWEDCPSCNGWIQIGDRMIPRRNTVNMICVDCGHDYSKENESGKS